MNFISLLLNISFRSPPLFNKGAGFVFSVNHKQKHSLFPVICVFYFQIKLLFQKGAVRCCTQEEHSYYAGLPRKFGSSEKVSTDTNKFTATSLEDAVQRIHVTNSRKLRIRKS